MSLDTSDLADVSATWRVKMDVADDNGVHVEWQYLVGDTWTMHSRNGFEEGYTDWRYVVADDTSLHLQCSDDDGATWAKHMRHN